MIKCIATDMDGTLLNSMQQISQENKEAILKAKNQGVEVVVATGRSYQEATFVLEEAGLKLPVICSNGAEIRDQNGGIVSTTPLPKLLARIVTERLQELGIYFEIYTNHGAFSLDTDKAVSILVDIVLSANPEVDPEEVTHKAGARVRAGLVHQIDDYELLFADENQHIYKVLAFSFEEEKLEKAKEMLADYQELAVSTSGHDNLEITNIEAQKGIALEAFVKSKGLELSETMAVGDNHNDVSMLERVGRAIAMGNASYYVQSLCDDITDTNDEHGVARAILEVL